MSEPDDPIWILESEHGWKVVFCHTQPQGGRASGNWKLLKDGLTHREALLYAVECRRVIADSGLAILPMYSDQLGEEFEDAGD